MAIQNRRGNYTDFDPTKMVAGEFAVVQNGDPDGTDGEAVYFAPKAGKAKRLVTADDVRNVISGELENIIAETEAALADDVQRAEDAADSVESSVTQIATNTADIADIKEDLEQLEPGLSDTAKRALLACFAKVGWIDEHGQDYYDALYDALYEGSPTPTPSFDYGIYEPDAVVTGKYIDENGDVQTGTTGTSFYIEDYIPVIRSNYWIGMNPSSLRVPAPSTSPTNSSDWRISEYDASKRFIKQTHFNSSNALCSSAIYDFDSNTKYIRLGWSDSNSSTNSKEFDIENPAEITVLPVEIGNIDASTGADTASTTRVRTVGYIPVSNTITISGCPFYDSWSGWISLWTSAGYSSDSFFYVVRCYDSNKAFLGTLTYEGAATVKQDISNVSLPEGTEYVRMLFQTENHAALSTTCINHLITINGTKYYMEKNALYHPYYELQNTATFTGVIGDSIDTNVPINTWANSDYTIAGEFTINNDGANRNVFSSVQGSSPWFGLAVMTYNNVLRIFAGSGDVDTTISANITTPIRFIIRHPANATTISVDLYADGTRYSHTANTQNNVSNNVTLKLGRPGDLTSNLFIGTISDFKIYKDFLFTENEVNNYLGG